MLSYHIKHEVSVCLLVLGAVEPVPVGAPQKRPAVAAEFLKQTALPTQAGDHYVGDPINSIRSYLTLSFAKLLVDDCFVFLVLKGHLDMVIVELDELELV